MPCIKAFKYSEAFRNQEYQKHQKSVCVSKRLPRYRSLQALQRPYLYGGPIISILLTGSFVQRWNSIQELSKCSLPRLSKPGSPSFPHVGWASKARELRELPNKLYPHNNQTQLNSTQYILKFSHRFFSFQTIPVYKTKHTVTHDCTESTSLQARSGHHGTSIHLLVRHESS
jgi:hypothetical protein